MLNLRKFLNHTGKPWLKASILAVLLFTLSLSFSAPSQAAKRPSSMPAGNAITDAEALLRYALPIDNDTVRDFQSSLEDIDNHIRAKRWGPITGDVRKASRVIGNTDDILDDIAAEQKPQAETLISALNTGVAELQKAVEAKDRDLVNEIKGKLLKQVGDLEELMVNEFPFEIPSEYANLPQLKGRATVQIETDKGLVTFVVDGYSAPITAGNFVDLVQRGFYNGLKFIRSEESYVLQAGDPDPKGPEDGFIDPATGQYRSIPLEVLVRGDKEPIYGITLEDAGLYREQPVLPFSAYGAVAMARVESEPDSASSQFFFFLFEPELTPAGLNLLDGRYAVFGYTIEGKEVLEKLKQGDTIISAKVIEGAENLVQPQAA